MSDDFVRDAMQGNVNFLKEKCDKLKAELVVQSNMHKLELAQAKAEYAALEKVYQMNRDAIADLKLMAESYRDILLKIVNDHDLQCEDINGLLDVARAALDTNKI